MLSYPNIDPVAIRIPFPSFLIGWITDIFGWSPQALDIRWYSLAYIAGILLGWCVVASEHKRKPIRNLTQKALDDMVVWAVGGIILGGRLGYVLFYKPDYYFAHPLEILFVWGGGMSFHGGLLGTILAFWLFCRKYKIRFLELSDVMASAACIGLFFGRMANFINGELWGRPTDVPWAMIFPHGGDVPRHPSQLYEAGMEGIALFALLFFLTRYTKARDKIGFLSGVFLAGYAISRIIAEFFREPDAFLGFLWGGATMGQLLSIPMLLIGLYLIFRNTPSPLRGKHERLLPMGEGRRKPG